MAELSIKRPLTTQLVLYASAVAASLIQSLKARFLGVHLVGRAELPFVILSFQILGGTAGGFHGCVFVLF